MGPRADRVTRPVAHSVARRRPVPRRRSPPRSSSSPSRDEEGEKDDQGRDEDKKDKHKNDPRKDAARVTLPCLTGTDTGGLPHPGQDAPGSGEEAESGALPEDPGDLTALRPPIVIGDQPGRPARRIRSTPSTRRSVRTA